MIKTKHIFLLSKIVDKMELDDNLKSVLAGTKNKKVNKTELGFTIIAGIGKKLHKAQDEILELVSEVTGKARKDVEEMSSKEMMKVLKDILSEEGVLDFLHSQQEDSK